MSINSVYSHLRNLGVGTRNDFLIARDLTLVAKTNKLIRSIQYIISKIPLFRHVWERTDLGFVIPSVRAEALRASPHKAEKVGARAEFIVKVLEGLQRGQDPHLLTLQRINQMAYHITTSSLSDVQKAIFNDRLKEIEGRYLALSADVGNLLDELSEHVDSLKAADKHIIRLSERITASKLTEAQKELFHSRIDEHRELFYSQTDDIGYLLEIITQDFERLEAEANARALLFGIVKGKVDPVAALTLGIIIPVVGLFMGLQPVVQDDDKIDLQQIDRCLERVSVNDVEELSGYTPLIYAAYNGLPRVVEHLVSKGALTDIKEKEGYNAYTMAKYYVNKYTGIIERSTDKQRDQETFGPKIERYQRVVDLLEPLTVDRAMPKRSWW